ncbi:protein of unknown function DUF6 transmembrane [Acidimicrobium ferrooxidans DSM 10331]|uniref:EamA domain-containing protein n=1 Tax=Acidimicrobium ferrooxidans (strain DSM 10331 / JCM 15462 / NBRC 103882 / ICP) TaxID=525909 RepID=C7LXT8_ACIFD|nr:DMT family transporter [Acidimicrobium ferrooxidans]ACU53546.1 protein of unknown function DUF6 transmembrane [Acidimicrobium ferrooxidans DSM 10331]
MERRSLAALGVLSVIWGCSFLFIKVGLATFSPDLIAFVRTTLGASVVLATARLRGWALPRGWRLWAKLAVAALVSNTLPFILFGYGEQHVSAVLAGFINATTPMFTFPLAVALKLERVSVGRIAGLAVGIVGVGAVVGIGTGAISGASGVGVLACLAAAALYAVGFVYVRMTLGLTGANRTGLAGGQLAMAALETGVVVLVMRQGIGTVHPLALAAVATLGVAGTGIAYIVNFALIHRSGVVGASLTTLTMTVVSTVAGVVVLGEPLRWYQPIGALAILVGAWLVQGARPVSTRLVPATE